ncbi:MAG: ABC transporter permease [Gammaproteobacteria bacterium]|nr:ABC transporter permease [Gammaproteobacteria bacterium]
MNPIAVVAHKEIVDNVRDRRTMASTLAFGPLFAPLMFTVMIQIVVDRAVTAAEQRLTIPMVGIEAAENLIDFLDARGIEPDDEHALTDLDSAAAAVAAGEHGVVIVADERFADDFSSDVPARLTVVFDRSNSRDSERVDRVRAVLQAYSERIAALRLLARGVSPTVMRPMTVDAYDVSTPTGRSALILGILTYFLLFAVLMGGMYLAIDTTAGERERKSLEPLLTTPVSRTTLLLGKIAATVVFMLISLALTLIGFTIALGFLPLDELGMSSGFTPATAVAAFWLLTPFALLGAVLMTLVASYTKSYKEAQTYLGLLLIVPTLPVAIATIMNVQPSAALMWVPSMSQHLLITAFIKQDPIGVTMVAQSVFSTLLYAGLLGFVAIRLYKREALLG